MPVVAEEFAVSPPIRAVENPVSGVFKGSSVRQILDRVVEIVPIEVTGVLAGWKRTNERFGH
jgi:hypothetical protein